MKCKNCNTEMNTYENVYSCPYCGYMEKEKGNRCVLCGKPTDGEICEECQGEMEE